MRVATFDLRAQHQARLTVRGLAADPDHARSLPATVKRRVDMAAAFPSGRVGAAQRVSSAREPWGCGRRHEDAVNR
jgi:hypothetical protein